MADSAPIDLQTMRFEFPGTRNPGRFAPLIVGVVGSGNLELLVEAAGDDRCHVEIRTSARGFETIWEAVCRGFQERHALAGVRLSINDMGATPAVVNLRLEQAMAQLGGMPR